MRSCFASLIILFALPHGCIADSFCGGGRRLGAENDGAGSSWKCIPSSSPVPLGGSSNGSRAAAALNLGSSVLSIASILAGSLQATDNAGPAESDEDRYGEQSRENNRKGMLEMQKGNFLRATVLFEMAASDAAEANNTLDMQRNQTNVEIAKAEESLEEGYHLELRGKYREASLSYHKAMNYADAAGSSNLVDRIKDHNVSVAQKAVHEGRGREVVPNSTTCDNVNGEMLCR